MAFDTKDDGGNSDGSGTCDGLPNRHQHQGRLSLWTAVALGIAMVCCLGALVVQSSPRRGVPPRAAAASGAQQQELSTPGWQEERSHTGATDEGGSVPVPTATGGSPGDAMSMMASTPTAVPEHESASSRGIGNNDDLKKERNSTDDNGELPTADNRIAQLSSVGEDSTCSLPREKSPSEGPTVFKGWNTAVDHVCLSLAHPWLQGRMLATNTSFCSDGGWSCATGGTPATRRAEGSSCAVELVLKNEFEHDILRLSQQQPQGRDVNSAETTRSNTNVSCFPAPADEIQEVQSDPRRVGRAMFVIANDLNWANLWHSVTRSIAQLALLLALKDAGTAQLSSHHEALSRGSDLWIVLVDNSDFLARTSAGTSRSTRCPIAVNMHLFFARLIRQSLLLLDETHDVQKNDEKDGDEKKADERGSGQPTSTRSTTGSRGREQRYPIVVTVGSNRLADEESGTGSGGGSQEGTLVERYVCFRKAFFGMEPLKHKKKHVAEAHASLVRLKRSVALIRRAVLRSVPNNSPPAYGSGVLEVVIVQRPSRRLLVRRQDTNSAAEGFAELCAHQKSLEESCSQYLRNSPSGLSSSRYERCRVQCVELEHRTLEEQVRIVGGAKILLGMHGAGLAWGFALGLGLQQPAAAAGSNANRSSHAVAAVDRNVLVELNYEGFSDASVNGVDRNPKSIFGLLAYLASPQGGEVAEGEQAPSPVAVHHLVYRAQEDRGEVQTQIGPADRPKVNYNVVLPLFKYTNLLRSAVCLALRSNSPGGDAIATCEPLAATEP